MGKHAKPYAVKILQQIHGAIDKKAEQAHSAIDIAEVIAIKPHVILQPLDGENTYDDDDILWNISPKTLKKNELVSIGRDSSGHIIVLGRPDEQSPDPTLHAKGKKMRAELTKVRKDVAEGVAHNSPVTIAVTGTVAVAAGDTDYIPPVFIPVIDNGRARLVGCRARINSGTSATISIQKNGMALGGYGSLVITPTASTSDRSDIALSDGDMLAVVVDSVSGTPKNMTVTLYIEYK